MLLSHVHNPHWYVQAKMFTLSFIASTNATASSLSSGASPTNSQAFRSIKESLTNGRITRHDISFILRSFFHRADERAFHIHAYKIRSLRILFFLYSAAVLKISSSSSTGSVIVAGAIVVTPTEASYFAIFFNSLFTVITEIISHTPVEMQIDQSRNCVCPCPSMTSSPSISGTFSVV